MVGFLSYQVPSGNPLFVMDDGSLIGKVSLGKISQPCAVD